MNVERVCTPDSVMKWCRESQVMGVGDVVLLQYDPEKYQGKVSLLTFYF